MMERRSVHEQSTTATETYEVTLEPSGKVITVKEGQTLLDAAIRNGVQVAYGCRHGVVQPVSVKSLMEILK